MSRKLGIAICIIVPLCFAFGRWSGAQKPPRYDNRALGFRIEGPDFSALGGQDEGQVVMMFGPVSGGFAPNLNIMVQPKSTPAEYREVTLSGIRQMGWEVRGEEKLKVDGRDALLMSYSGSMQGRNLEWLALAVFDKERTYLATCTATPDQFAKVKSAFRASLSSFKFLDTGREGGH